MSRQWFFLTSKTNNVMKQYTGTKTILARPMNRLDYNKYRGWELPADENGADEGYLVEYIDGGKSNHPDHKGYISWSPKKQFEGAYRPSGTPQDRLLIETRQAADRLNNLNAFMASDKFPKLKRYQKSKLYRQQRIMSEYVELLGERLEDFGEEFSHED